jgi:hypothetical protein
MDDEQFLTTINKVTADNHLRLPVIDSARPSAEAVAAWAGFLELCVKKGIRMSDPRWPLLALVRSKPVTAFELHGATGEPRDPDFRVGLQLLMGMLETDSPGE